MGDAVDVCLAVGMVPARGRRRMEEIVLAEVDIMEATVEMVEGEGGEEIVEEEEAEMAEAEEEEETAEEEEEAEAEEETAEGVVDEAEMLVFWVLAAVPRKVGDATGSGGDIWRVREEHNSGTNFFSQNPCTFSLKYMTTRTEVVRITKVTSAPICIVQVCTCTSTYLYATYRHQKATLKSPVKPSSKGIRSLKPGTRSR